MSGATSVLVAATGNVNISTGLVNGAVIDGVTLATGNDVLLPFQSTPSQNGIYLVVASGAASRDPNYSTYASLLGLLVTVESGNTYANTLWQSQAPPGGTLGTTAIPFASPELPSPTILGTATFAAGSVSAPSVTFGDTQTGLYRPGANELGMSISGVNSFSLGGGAQNTSLGVSTLSALSSGVQNTAIGYNSGYGVSTGGYNVTIGVAAGSALGAGSYNVLIGRDAGSASTGSTNIAIGPNALQNATSSNNVAIGSNALVDQTSGSQNVAIGAGTLSSNIAGWNNLALGYQALQYTTGTENTGLGLNAGNGITSGGFNVVIGSSSGAALGAGSYDVFIGRQAGQNATASSCVGIGASALQNVTGSDNVAIGTSAAASLTTATRNIAIGSNALAAATTLGANTAIGYDALAVSIGASPYGSNTAIGCSAAPNTTTGFEMVAVGVNAANNNTTGYWHVAMGVEALYSNTTGNNNTAIGLSCLHDTTTGSWNTGLGFGAGIGLGPNQPNAQQTGSYNTFIGAQTAAASSTQQSQLTIIGANASAALSDAIVLGRTDTDVVYAGETVLGPNPASGAIAGGIAVGHSSIVAARTVATLPAASAALMGARSFVTDATAPTFLGTLTGGGSVVCPVFCNGSAWVAG
jgi:hypothetical protein